MNVKVEFYCDGFYSTIISLPDSVSLLPKCVCYVSSGAFNHESETLCPRGYLVKKIVAAKLGVSMREVDLISGKIID